MRVHADSDIMPNIYLTMLLFQGVVMMSHVVCVIFDTMSVNGYSAVSFIECLSIMPIYLMPFPFLKLEFNFILFLLQERY